MNPISPATCERVLRKLELPGKLSDEDVAFIGACCREYVIPPKKLSEIRRRISKREDISPLVLLTAEESELLPKRGFLRDFIAYTMSVESPFLWLLWSAIGAVSVSLRRQIHLDWQWYTIYPNHWLIFVGPSGAGKSISSKIAMRMLRKVPDINILAGETTPEALIESLASLSEPPVFAEQCVVEPTATALIHADELAVFLGKQKYKAGLTQLLTQLYDCDEDFEKRLRSGKFQVKSPCLSIIAATTPDDLSEAIPSSAFGAGFMGRIVFVVQQRGHRSVPFPKEEQNTSYSLASLTASLCDISKLAGQVELSQEAYSWYEEWYYSARRFMVTEELGLAGYQSRRHVHLLRLAMIYQATYAEGNDRLVLDVEALEDAYNLLLHTEMQMGQAFQQVNQTVAGKVYRRISEQIRKRKTITHSELLRLNSAYGVAAKDVEEIVKQLLAEERIKTGHTKAGGKRGYSWIE